MVVSQSNMGFQTRVWGASCWPLLHMCSLNYPIRPREVDKRRYLGFFESLEWVLPCRSCRESYGDIIRRRGGTRLTMATMKDRESVARWMYAVHDAVNKRIGKRTPISFEGMCKRYEKFRASSCDKHTCDQELLRKRKRAVVMVMSDKTYKSLGCRSSLVECS